MSSQRPPARTPEQRARDAEAERDRERMERRNAERDRDRAQRNVIAILTQLGGSITIERETLAKLDEWEQLIETHVDRVNGNTVLRLVTAGRRN